MHQVVIIGGGMAGMTAAIYAARAALNPLVLVGPLQGGALTQSHEIENYPGFVDAISCTQLTDAIENQAKRLGAIFEFETVERLEDRDTHFVLFLNSGRTIETHTVILATGTRPRKLDVAGMTEFYGHGVSSCAVCDGFFYRGKVVSIIGGGNTALYEALYLAKICSHVHVIYRAENLTAEQVTQEKVRELPNVTLHSHAELRAVKGTQFLTDIDLIHNQTQQTFNLPTDGLFIATGVVPNTDFLKGFIDLDEWGFVKTTGLSTHTTRKGIFVAGDMTAGLYQQAVIAAGTGASAALDAEHFLHQKRTS